MEIQNSLSKQHSIVNRETEELDKLEREFRTSVIKYQEERELLIQREIKKNGLAYCFACYSFHRRNEGFLVCVVKNEYYEHGYENSCYGYQPSSTVFIACPECYVKLKAKDGWKGPYDQMARDQASFALYDVEVNFEGEFICSRYNGGKSVVLEEHLRKLLKNVPKQKIEALAYQLLLPKDIKLIGKEVIEVDWPE